jgi:dolichol-phosphate mannosyltransferase
MLRIVLPAYNEEAALEKLIVAISVAMQASGLKYEIIVVNDGSNDRTLEIARNCGTALPVQVIDHVQNKGLGEALKSGLKRAAELCNSEDVIVTMDADNTHPPDLIPTMISKIEEGYDLAIASRFVTGAKEYGLSSHRKVLSRGASILMRTLFPTKNVKDYTCGYRAYRATVLQNAFAVYGETFICEKGFNAIVEILLKLRRQGLRACEVPLLLHYDRKEGASKMPIMKTILRYWALIVHQLIASKNKAFIA